MNEKVLVFQEKEESLSEDNLNLTLLLKKFQKSMYDHIFAEFNLYNMELFSGPEEQINLDLNLFQIEEV